MQIDPAPELSRLIKHFLILENDTLNGVVHRLIPDGNPGIVFHYETPLLQNAGSNTPYIRQPKSFCTPLHKYHSFFKRDLETIQTFLIGKFQIAPDQIVKNSIDWMKAHPDSASINELVAELPIGERQSERAFKTHVGVSPKLSAFYNFQPIPLSKFVTWKI
jgi:hypothetical protein